MEGSTVIILELIFIRKAFYTKATILTSSRRIQCSHINKCRVSLIWSVQRHSNNNVSMILSSDNRTIQSYCDCTCMQLCRKTMLESLH